MHQRIIDSPIGKLLISAQDGFLVQLRMAGQGENVMDAHDPVLDAAQSQIAQYFAGERKTFDLPLALRGTAFEQAVWHALLEIAYGDVQSYSALARRLDKPAAARAVGGACARNPLLIVVPCHRVIASSGRLTGFAGGMEAKRALLTLEGCTIRKDCVIIK